YGRNRKLLSRLRGAADRAARAQSRRRIRIPRCALASERRASRRAEQALATARIRQLSSEPRSDRQSRVRQALGGAVEIGTARGWVRDSTAGSAAPDALHGRGVCSVPTLPLLLRLHR